MLLALFLQYLIWFFILPLILLNFSPVAAISLEIKGIKYSFFPNFNTNCN